MHSSATRSTALTRQTGMNCDDLLSICRISSISSRRKGTRERGKWRPSEDVAGSQMSQVVKEISPTLPSESALVTFESGFNVLQHSHHRGASHVLIRFAAQIIGDPVRYRFGETGPG